MARDITTIRICEVLDVDDSTGMDRIKVRLRPEDDAKTDINDIDYVFPLLPKYFFVKPKIGESVLVLLMAANDGNSQRFYIGPIVTQMNQMENNNFGGKADVFLKGSENSPERSPYLDKFAEGIYPEDSDVSIVGKKNSDIQLKKDDLRLRCGFRVPTPDAISGLMYNKKDPAYIKLKYDDQPGEKEYRSTVSIVGDRINLLGNQSKEYFNTTDKKELIPEKEMERIMKEAHKLPYGDVLIEFMDLFRKAFLTHTHPLSMLPPCCSLTGDKSAVLAANLAEYNLDDMLSDTVRIN